MNGKSAIMLALAVFCGLGAMYGTSRLLSKDKGPAPVVMRNVVIAVRALKSEEIIKDDMVKVVQLPKDQVPAGSFSATTDLLNRSIQIPILEGEALVDPKLAPKGAPPGLVAQIPKGMRAFAIEVNEQSGVSGFILPGHRVDVVQTEENRGPTRSQAEIILQNVLVLASGQVFTRPEDKSIMSRTVTLALMPEQVEEVVAARIRGPLSLSLRGLNDHELLVRAEPEPEPTPAPLPEPPPPIEPEPIAAVEPLPAAEPPQRNLTIFHGMHAFERHSLGATPNEPDPGR